jgi:hypothetical protein
MSGDNAEDREIARRIMSKAEREQLERNSHGLTEPSPNAPQSSTHCAELMIWLRKSESRLAAAEAENKRLREALEYYADPENWLADEFFPPDSVGDVAGPELARRALAGEPAKDDE